MPPRYAYWTILAGGLPTAFRAAEKAELLPTFSRIRDKHPDAEMKWFARGRLWDSPESAKLDLDLQRRGDNRRGRHDTGSKPLSAEKRSSGRGRDWRPGGEHRDTRQRYKDAKTARNVEQRRRKFERRQRTAGGSQSRGFPGRKPFPPSRGAEEPQPPAPPRPNREPRRREGTDPTPPPRPTEPGVPPPGPPERGRPNRKGGKKRL